MHSLILCPQVTDRVPVGLPLYNQIVEHLFENYASMELRIDKMQDTAVCWAEEPDSRTRRLITNVLVNKTTQEDEIAVCSYFLLTRNHNVRR